MKRLLLLTVVFLFVACASQKPKATPEIKSVTHVTEAAPAPRTQIQEVSKKGNFFRINVGTENGITLGKRFVILGPDQSPLFTGQVVALRPKSAFLRVKSAKAPAAALQVGLEAVPEQP